MQGADQALAGFDIRSFHAEHGRRGEGSASGLATVTGDGERDTETQGDIGVKGAFDPVTDAGLGVLAGRSDLDEADGSTLDGCVHKLKCFGFLYDDFGVSILTEIVRALKFKGEFNASGLAASHEVTITHAVSHHREDEPIFALLATTIVIFGSLAKHHVVVAILASAHVLDEFSLEGDEMRLAVAINHDDLTPGRDLALSLVGRAVFVSWITISVVAKLDSADRIEFRIFHDDHRLIAQSR